MTLDAAILGLPGLETITITRRDGAYASGEWVPDNETTFDIQCNPQPAGPTEMQRLPEGQRSRGGIVLFVSGSSTALRIADQETGLMADRFTWRGQVYEVDAIEDWSAHGYQEALCTRRDT